MLDIEDSDDLLYVQNTTGTLVQYCALPSMGIFYIAECFYVHTLVIRGARTQITTERSQNMPL